MFVGVDESLKEQIRSNLLEKYNRGKIDLNSMSTSELKKYIKAEAISIKKNLSNIIRNSNFNKKNLIEGIANTIPKNLDDLTKARMVYLKLNQSVFYSDQYFALSRDRRITENRNELSKIYNRNFDISNLSTNAVVCSNWSKIYAELLKEVGVNSNKIEIKKAGEGEGSHQWVKMKLDNGKVLLADATNNINGMTDLANSKLGNSTAGFIITTEEEYAKERENWTNDALTFREIGLKGNSRITKIDENIGYSSQEYMKDFQSIVDTYEKSISTSISVNEKINIFKDLLNCDKYSAIDIYSISRKYASKILKLSTYSELYTKGSNVITVITVKGNNNNKKYIYKINDSKINVTNNIDNIIKGAKKI